MRIFVDMDDTIVDFKRGFLRAREAHPDVEWPHSVPGFFLDLEPIEGAIDSVEWLYTHPRAELHILTSPSLRNPHSYTEKRLWVAEHLGYEFVKRLHISPDKGLFRGDVLIDDNIAGQGQEHFPGRVLHFGSQPYPSWQEIRNELERSLADA